MALRRDTVLLVVLFLAAFLGTVLLVAGTDILNAVGFGEAESRQPAHSGQPGGPVAPHALHAPTRPGASGTDATAGNARDNAAKLASLQVDLLTDKGQVGLVQAALTPPAGELTDNRNGSFTLQKIPPGRYRLTVWATDFQPIRGEFLEFTAGEAKALKLNIRAGITPKGSTVDAETRVPVANARVEFTGHAHVQSDANGEFQVPWALPPEALEDLVVSHPEYDTIALRRHAWGDVNRMQIGLGRGKGAVIGRLTQMGTREIPAQARVRAYMTNSDNSRELRREILFNASGEFEIPRMTYGAYALVVDFPGTNLPARTEEVHVGSQQPVQVVFPFGGGTRLEGTLRARAGAPLPTRVELIGEDGLSVLEVTSAEGGVFLMEAAPAGRWRLRVHWGMPWFNTDHFEIGAEEPVHLLEVDCDKKLIVR